MTTRRAGRYITDVLSRSFALSTVVFLKRGTPDMRYTNPRADAPQKYISPNMPVTTKNKDTGISKKACHNICLFVLLDSFSITGSI